MKTVRTSSLLRALSGAVCLFAVGAVCAQTTPAARKPATKTPAAEQASFEETIVLSPFVVNTKQDTGYIATDSLAGTRLRTPLKGIAASVSVITRDFLYDIGATNTEDLLVYTTDTEVVGGDAGQSGGTAGGGRSA